MPRPEEGDLSVPTKVSLLVYLNYFFVSMYQLAGLEFTVLTRLARFASASVSQITSSVLAQINLILSPPRKPSTSVLLQF